MTKALKERGYKPVAVQDDCFMGTENGKETIVVLVRYEKQGKKNILVKYDAIEFPNIYFLDKWMQDNKIEKATPSEDFKAPPVNQALHLIKAL